MAESITNVTTANWDVEVVGNDRLVLVDFRADWCPHCRDLDPIYKELSGEHLEVKFCVVDSDKERALTQKHDVEGIPTVLSFKNGQRIDASVGPNKDDLLRMMENKKAISCGPTTKVRY